LIANDLSRRGVWGALDKERIMQINFVWKPLNFSPELYDSFEEMDCSRNVLLNHFKQNKLICTKSGLVKSLRRYYTHHTNNAFLKKSLIFETMPTTFIMNSNKRSGEFQNFADRFAELESKNYTHKKMPVKHCESNVWFIKPEASNQGRVITLLR
jgi:hypothetical protein